MMPLPTAAEVIYLRFHRRTGAVAIGNVVVQRCSATHEADADSRTIERTVGCPHIGVGRISRRLRTCSKHYKASHRNGPFHFTTLKDGSSNLGSSSMPLMTKPISEG